jgi:cytochrome c biogenesis protein CcmG/thiol:disulfide interchange protein DsbE
MNHNPSTWKNSLGTFVGVCAILALVALLAWALGRVGGNLGKSALIGKPAREFQLPLLKEGSVSLADYKGRPLMLNFWASWCSSCRSEAREIEAFWQTHQDKIAVLGVAVQDTADAVREAVAAQGKTYPIALDEEGRVNIDYGVTGVPETFFVDAAGIVRHKVSGPMTAAEMAKILEILLTEGDKGQH